MLLTRASIAIADEYRYSIDTLDGINQNKTSAVVDIVNHEIRLPKYMPNMVDFLGDGLEYIVLTPEGVKRVNTDGSMDTVVATSALDNPISAIAGSSNYPDFVVAHGSKVTHFSFAGHYVANPALSSQGYTGILSIGTKELDYAVLTDTVSYQAFTGNEMVEAFSVGGFSNPIAMSLFKDHYGMAVIDGEEVKYFKNGSLTHSITGLTNALSVSTANGGNLAVVTDKQVKHYNLLADDTFAENTCLSVTAGLNSPTCVALRPGGYDRLIVDGNNINYYMWDGTKLTLNPTMSKTITGLQDLGKYLPQAVAESKVYSVGREVTHIKLYIDDPFKHTQQPGTSIEWYVTARDDAEANWRQVVELGKWVEVEPGSKIRWKAVLKTNDREKTPIIYPTIVLQTNSKPNPPMIDAPPLYGEDRCYLDSTPVIRWLFDDPDIGDSQGGFQVIVYANGNIIEDSGYIPGETNEYIVDANHTGKLYESGVNLFTVEVTVKDEAGVASEPSFKQFCVIAFDRPYTEIITPSSSGFISKDCTKNLLPSTKAGGLVTVKTYSIGVNSVAFTFPYLTEQSTIVETPKKVESKGNNHRWEVSFYTNANTDLCPEGTIVNGYFTGNGVPSLMYLDDTSVPSDKPPKWWQWEGYRKWAEGVVKIGESVFENWSIVLQGRVTE